MTFEDWWQEMLSNSPAPIPSMFTHEQTWEAAYHQAIQDIIDYSEHMGDVEKFARQHGIKVED